MMLGGPEAVVAELVHQAGDIARGPEHLAQALVRIAAVVRWGAIEADIVERDLTDIKRVKPFDHVVLPQLVHGRIAAATSSGLSSSARCPAPGIVVISVRPAIAAAKRSA